MTTAGLLGDVLDDSLSFDHSLMSAARALYVRSKLLADQYGTLFV